VGEWRCAYAEHAFFGLLFEQQALREPFELHEVATCFIIKRTGAPMFDVRLRSALAASATALLLTGPVFAQQQTEPPLEQQPDQQAEQPIDQQPDQQAEQPADQQAAQQPDEIPEAMGAPLHLSSDDVRAVQEALQQAGHEPGDPDGLWGEQSQAAMREYQEAEGLPVSGNIDMASIRALQLWDTIMSAEGTTPETTEPGIATDVDPDAADDTATRDPVDDPEQDAAEEDAEEDAAEEDADDVAEPEDDDDPTN
jgi:hypothetical protein